VSLRDAGKARGNTRLSTIGDLFEPIPVLLAQASRENGGFDDVLVRLRERAQRQGLLAWLEGEVANPSRTSDGQGHDSRELLYRLLFMALVDMRAEAADTGNEEAWRVAHLFHRIPLQLARVRPADGSYTDLLAQLQGDAQRLGCAVWLEHASEDTARPAAAGVEGEAGA
jgi:hypothetical protein